MGYDYFDGDEFDDNFFSSYNPAEILKQIAEIKKANYDAREKRVGDRVEIWDFSGCITDTGEPVVSDILVNKECIIIETGVESEFRLSVFSKTIQNRDLMVFCPETGKVYHTASDFVKRLDKNK